MCCMSRIPTTGFLIDLMQEEKLHPDGFLDILEKKFREDPDSLVAEDLYDLYRSGRISKSEYVSHEKSWPDDESEAEPQSELRSLTEVYHNTDDGTHR